MKCILKISMLWVFLAGLSAHAQTDWQWANSGGSESGSALGGEDEKVRDIAVDQNGNSYVVSYINVSNPEIAGNPVTVYSDPYYNDIALAAFDCSGNYKWSKIIGSYYGDVIRSGSFRMRAVETDTLGHVYIAGKVMPGYQGASTKPVNFSTDTIIPYSTNDNLYKKTIFLAQYDTQGNLKWLRMPQADNIYNADAWQEYSHGISISPDGNTYWMVQIQPGTYANGAFVNTTPGWSLYIFHYDVNGVFQNAIPMDFKAETDAPYINFDWVRDHTSGRFYVCGWFNYNHQDRPNPTLGNNTVTQSMYAGAFDAQGNFLWMHESTDTYTSYDLNGFAVGQIKAMTLDDQGNLYLTGASSDGDFFAGGEIVSDAYPPPFPPDIYPFVPFVVKLDPDGNLQWINNATFSGGAGMDIALNGKEVAITGSYVDIKWGNVDIDNPSNTGGRAYLIQLNKNTGNFISLDSIHNLQHAGLLEGTALTTDPRGNYYVGGVFAGALEAGSHPSTSNGGPTDFFVAKFGENNCNCTLPKADFTYQNDGQGDITFTYTGTGNYDELEWGFGDGNISTAASPTHTYAQDGLYWVCVTVYDSCGYNTYCEEVDTNLNTSVFEATAIQVYPNPANTQVFVSTKETLHYNLYDLSGRKIKSGKLAKGETSISLTGLSQGLYLLQMENEEGQTNVLKLLKE